MPSDNNLITFGPFNDIPILASSNFPTISGTVTIDGRNATKLVINNTFHVNSGAVVTLTHLDVSYASTTGIYNNGTTTLLNSNLSHNGNFLEGGTGIINQGLMFVANTTISHHAGGGGIQNEGTLTLTHTTLSNNSCYNLHGDCVLTAGGLNNSGTLYWYNSLIANSDGPDCNNTGTIAASVNNLVEDGTCTPTFTGAPLLGPLQYNGGPTPTYALLPGSPAIDTADNTYCPPTDQRDHLRPQDGDNNGSALCDLGAFEALWSFTHALPAIFNLTMNP